MCESGDIPKSRGMTIFHIHNSYNIELKLYSRLCPANIHISLIEYSVYRFLAGLGSSTVDQVLKYIKYPKHLPSTSTGQVLIF